MHGWQTGTGAEDRGQFPAQEAHDFAVSARFLPPKVFDLTSEGLVSKAIAQQADKPQRQLCPSPIQAGAMQSSQRAGTDQNTQPDSLAMSEHESSIEAPQPHLGSDLCMPEPTGIPQADTAVDQRHETPPVSCLHLQSAYDTSDIGSQSAADIIEHSDPVMHPAAVPFVHSSSSSGCQREASGKIKQLNAQGEPVVGTANPRCKTVPQSSAGGPQDAPKAEHSPSAAKACSEGCSSPSSQGAEDASECGPAEDKPVLQENQALQPTAKRHSQSSDKAGISVTVNRPSISKNPGSLPMRCSRSADKAAASSKPDSQVTSTSGNVEAANKENDVSSASLAASDSQAGAQAVLLEEQAKTAATAAAQVDVACVCACCSSLSI